MAIQVNGTTVINNSRALNNISSIDATTAAAIGNAGVGGGTVGFQTSSVTSSSTFTKPADGYSLSNNFFTNLNTQYTGSPSTTYKALTGTTSTASTIVEITYTVQNPDTYALRPDGGYYGEDIMVGIENTTSNYSKAFANIAAGWTSQTSFPATYKTGLIILNQNERPCIWISDVYSVAKYNSNLVLGSGDIVISTRLLTIT